jgi:hypothetical protein
VLILSAISPRLKMKLRTLLAGLMAVVLLVASALPATAFAEDPAEVTVLAHSADHDPSDEGMSKLLHSCAHCQSHHIATLATLTPDLSTVSFFLTAWLVRDEHRESMPGSPLPRPPKA